MTENLLILKYEKQAIAAALNREDPFMLLRTALRESWIYQVLLFIVSRDTLPIGNSFLIENFTGALIMNFIPNKESSIVNQSGLQICQKIDVIAQK